MSCSVSWVWIEFQVCAGTYMIWIIALSYLSVAVSIIKLINNLFSFNIRHKIWTRSVTCPWYAHHSISDLIIILHLYILLLIYVIIIDTKISCSRLHILIIVVVQLFFTWYYLLGLISWVLNPSLEDKEGKPTPADDP